MSISPTGSDGSASPMNVTYPDNWESERNIARQGAFGKRVAMGPPEGDPRGGRQIRRRLNSSLRLEFNESPTRRFDQPPPAQRRVFQRALQNADPQIQAYLARQATTQTALLHDGTPGVPASSFQTPSPTTTRTVALLDRAPGVSPRSFQSPLPVSRKPLDSERRKPNLMPLFSIQIPKLEAKDLGGIPAVIPGMEKWTTERSVTCDNKKYLLLEDLTGMRNGQLALTMLAVDLHEREQVTAYVKDCIDNFNKEFPYPAGLKAFAKNLHLNNLSHYFYDTEESAESLLHDLQHGPVLVCRMEENDTSIECREWVLITPLTNGEFLVRQPGLGEAHRVNATELKASYRGEEVTVIKQRRRRRLWGIESS